MPATPSTVAAAGFNSLVHFWDNKAALQVESSGYINVASNGLINVASGGSLSVAGTETIASGGALAVASGATQSIAGAATVASGGTVTVAAGAIMTISSSGQLRLPLEGSTSTTGLASTAVSITNFGVTFIPMFGGGAGSTGRTYALDIPQAGVTKTIVLYSSSSSGIVNIDAGAVTNFLSTDLLTLARFAGAATSGSSGRTTLKLIGWSTTIWLVESIQPSSAIVFGATTL